MQRPINHRKQRLYCPGPTPVPLDASIRALETNIYHRSPEFKEVFKETADKLKPFFDSDQSPLILTSSGTGALEAAVTNLTDYNDEVMVINGGKFGERWNLMAKAYGCHTHTLEIPWGQSPNIDEIEKVLKANPNIKALFIQANETSTGVAFPIETIAKRVRSISSEILIIVDAVSALVAHHVKLNSWDLDCIISGSQKGFGVPPGLAFLSMSKRAIDRMSTRPRFYFDLKKEFKNQIEGQSCWTPATSLILTLNRSLDYLCELGVDGCVEHHKAMSEACREGVKALGLELFSQDHHSQALTAINLPESIDGNKLIKLCRERYGAYFAGGQDQAKGKIVRIAHLGIFDQFELITGLSILEQGLSDLGYEFELGASLTAATRHMRNRHQP